jgi:mono/diheme cytochrome c family protein
MRGYSIRLASALALASTLGLSQLSMADDADQKQVEIGKQNHLRYCGSCHGPNGKGDGILSGTLKQKPADLTLIAQKNGGKFPTAEIVSFIDGTKPVAAHGDREMPVWGEVMKEESPGALGQEAVVQAKITSIVNYLKSIQQP